MGRNQLISRELIVKIGCRFDTYASTCPNSFLPYLNDLLDIRPRMIGGFQQRGSRRYSGPVRCTFRTELFLQIKYRFQQDSNRSAFDFYQWFLLGVSDLGNNHEFAVTRGRLFVFL